MIAYFFQKRRKNGTAWALNAGHLVHALQPSSASAFFERSVTRVPHLR